ncbi:MAG: dihydrofolate reductase [Candidatus Taylorbacteria bacterium]|nr:dihydrofolate reductase [Candidatus Taylorbacteria bacterium]
MMQMKTKFIMIVVLSLDGKISDNSKKLPNWTSKEDWKWFQNMLTICDAVIVGRKTYQVAKNNIDKRKAFVLSKKYKGQIGSVTFADSLKKIKKLAQRYKTVAVLGGQDVYSAAIKIDMVNELYITVEPIILGKGISFLGNKILVRHKFILKDSEILNKKGSILLHYKLNQTHDRNTNKDKNL